MEGNHFTSFKTTQLKLTDHYASDACKFNKTFVLLRDVAPHIVHAKINQPKLLEIYEISKQWNVTKKKT